MQSMTSPHALISVEKFSGHYEINIVPYTCTESVGNEFIIVYTEEEVQSAVNAWNSRVNVIRILEQYTTEMENYSYYGSNPGIPEECYYDLANSILEGINKSAAG